MISPATERCHPHVRLVTRQVHAIDEILDNARIPSYPWQNIDVCRVGPYGGKVGYFFARCSENLKGSKENPGGGGGRVKMKIETMKNA